ncbi:non-ribosomal peptide synthetase [Catellatospora bangladeshensis]|uniref:Carrier domain-containing protein n=1 Tax=Catellatospora bangladeshensis TaxID=310355 RepID=A0A8J3JCG1_9ACTN|nr:non-ribosomal peptide synthetase [Catellatospora bangladeshensis]GIF82322.1 hypothetical protein Cba03nite_36710 [Catellatospora bangladeshensis]
MDAVTRELVLGAYAGSAYDDGPFQAIPSMIEEQAGRRPDRPALTYQRRTLSYRDVDELANGLGGQLRDLGVTRGDVVPVLLANGLEMPIAYLALMKLAAAFVPLDPAWPADRLRATIGALRPRLVLCADPAAVPEELRGLALPLDVDQISRAPEGLGTPATADDLCYGIFTSGTTGEPKCALNLHAGLTNRFRFMTRYFAATGDEVVLQNSKHTFDSSVWQLFWPLTTGARCVIPAQGEFLDLEHTIATIAEHRITMTDFVPSIFNLLVTIVDRDRRSLAKISTLRQLIVGGEEISPRMAHRLGALLPDLRITNGYGPTEASIGMIFHPVSADDGDVIPLGRPIDNCYAVIVDDELRPLPPGTPGEIVIGGVCLGRGYLDDPVRTAEVFVRNPFPELPGPLLYRTGDLGHVDDRGRFFFHGRKDSQVKIAGVRIELGEIEAAAASCPELRECRVLVHTADGGRSLAIFAAGDERLTEASLRAHLREVLPRTMLPRHYVVLPELPLTGNGKVDRRALSGMLARRLARELPEPATLADRVLHVLRIALGQPGLGGEDDFFRSGGDSLQALAAVTELARETGTDIGVQDLIDAPTAAALTDLVWRRSGDADPGVRDGTLALADAAVPADLLIRDGGPFAEPRVVLLTGATGFVGARLAYELLSGTELEIVCLCRAAGDADALARVTAALAGQGLWEPRFAPRLSAYAGDLARPRLGLRDEVWDHLAEACDTVLHNGAMVNFLYDYRAHRTANVLGTQELLRLAMTGRVKPIHHISTLGALEAEAALHTRPLPEDVDVPAVQPPIGGYSLSKLVAERLLAEARRRGAPVTVYRLGEIMPAADNGWPNRRALTHLLLSAFHRLKMSPAVPMRSDYTPVDYAARRVVAGLRDPRAAGGTLHVFHPESVSYPELPARGVATWSTVDCRTFVAGLREAAGDTSDWELSTLLALLRLPDGADEATLARRFGGLLTDNPVLFGNDACQALAQRWGLSDEPLHGSMAAYHRWLSGPGALPAPRDPMPPGDAVPLHPAAF